MTSQKILGVKVDFELSFEDVLKTIEEKYLVDGKTHIICTTNPEFVMDAQNDEDFKKIINESDMSIPDGTGVIYAKNYIDKIAKIKKDIMFPIKAFATGCSIGLSSLFNKNHIIKERLTGVDLTYRICELSSRNKYNIFLLGGRHKNAVGKSLDISDSDMATETANVLAGMYPGLNIVGATSRFNSSLEHDQQTVDYIKQCMNEKDVDHIDFLFVAYGHSKQEKWIQRNKDKIFAKVSIGCGGTFDFIVGNCKLPPEIYINKNLGWLYRLIKQPWRIKRVFKAFPIFPLKVYFESVNNCL